MKTLNSKERQDPQLKSLISMWANRELEVITKLEDDMGLSYQSKRVPVIYPFGETKTVRYISQAEADEYQRLLEQAQMALHNQNLTEKITKVKEAVKPKVEDIGLNSPEDFDFYDFEVPDFRKTAHYFEHSTLSESHSSRFSELSMSKEPKDQTLDEILRESNLSHRSEKQSVAKLEQDCFGKPSDDDEEELTRLTIQNAIAAGVLTKVNLAPQVYIRLENSVSQNPTDDITCFVFNFKQEGKLHVITNVAVKAADNLFMLSHTGGLFSYDTKKGPGGARLIKYLVEEKKDPKSQTPATRGSNLALKSATHGPNESIYAEEYPDTAEFLTGQVEFMHVDPDSQMLVMVKDDIWHRFRTNKVEHEILLIEGRSPPLGKLLDLTGSGLLLSNTHN